MNYFGFTEHREVKFTLYCSLLSVIALCLKNVHTLIKKCFLAKKDKSSPEPLRSRNGCAGGGFEILELPKCDSET